MKNDVTNEFQGEFWNEFFRLFGGKKPFVLEKFKEPDRLGTIRNYYRMTCQHCGFEIEKTSRKHTLYHRECSKDLCIEKKAFVAENLIAIVVLCAFCIIFQFIQSYEIHHSK